MGRFLKRHRYTCILLLFFILIVVLGFKVKDILVPDEGKATYGERLKDIDKHPIEDSVYAKIDEEYGKNSKVKKVEHRVQGRIINYIFTVDDGMSIKDAKAVGENLIKLFEDDVLEYYSIQIYVVKEDEAKNNFPIMGMKNPKSKVVVWTKDREITESEKNEE